MGMNILKKLVIFLFIFEIGYTYELNEFRKQDKTT